MICRRHLPLTPAFSDYRTADSAAGMLKIVSAEFIKGAVNSKQFPQTGIPEYAFFGRSNAGKSSLINMLLNRKNLVKTGSKPGMTREINFFIVNAPAKTGTAGNTSSGSGKQALHIGNHRSSAALHSGGQTAADNLYQRAGTKTFCVADLPGYGFAQVSLSERNMIDRMLYDYCTVRTELKTMFLLMDIRRDPTETEQRTLAFFRDRKIETVLTATKADKLSKNEQMRRITVFASFFDCEKESILLTSSTKKIGREKLLQYVSACFTV